MEVAYKFSGLDGKKGQTPIGGLTLDSAGNFYGTTEEGGNAACFGYGGCGEIFKLAPDGSGWTLSTIATFDGAHGASPQGGVIIDGAGNLYGTASAGGDLNCNAPVGCGVVFEVTP